MKRLLSGLALAAIFGMASTSAGATAVDQTSSDKCTGADVQHFAHAGFEVARLHFNHPTGSEALHARADHIWDECQFRFYDDNDAEGSENNPEVPHVFSEDEYFLGGVFIFYFDFELNADFDRSDAIADLKLITDRIFWGPSSVADSDLQELAVTSGPYRNGVLPVALAVGNHRYIIFPPGSLEPGEYKWRHEQSYLGAETSSMNSWWTGKVIITPSS